MIITPEDAPIGATVSDVDVADLTDDEAARIADAWAEHGVLFFREQHLTEDQHIAFAERFAAIDVNRFFTPHETHPQIALVLKEPDQEVNIGGAWHTDHSYDEIPARGSILLARKVPESGGDTRFLSVAAVYDSLSEGLKATLESLEAYHSNIHIFGEDALAKRAVGDRFAGSDGVGTTVHPVVVEHPVTGRKLLYVNPGFTTHFVGWTREESAALLQYLYSHAHNGDFATQFHWEPGSIAMWDNRSTWHWALNDYSGERRLMHRITIAGERISEASRRVA